MNELIAFVLGIFAKAFVAALAGKVVSLVADELAQWPTVLHYLEQHTGKSFNCPVCLGTYHPPVDTVSK